MNLEQSDDQWYMDSGATDHITGDQGKISDPSLSIPIGSIFVGNGARVKILGSGNSTLPTPTRDLKLNNILYTPHIVKNLISVRKFSIDNDVSIEFDPHGFSVKEYKSGTLLSRHNSSSQLYPLIYPVSASTVLTSSFQDVWHDRLGHPGLPVFDFLVSNKLIPCNKRARTLVCNSCQLSKHKRLPFSISHSTSLLPFDIVHCDLWTSPVTSKNGYKYYLVLVDDFSQYTWVFPLKFKSETFTKFSNFHAYIKTQFNTFIKTFQCDLGGEFDNNPFKTFASTNGLQFRFSCPHTSQQNGKSERMIRRLNEIMLTLLTHASLPPNFWVEALHTACYLHNILPTKLLKFHTPTSALYRRHPTYDHLRVFGCTCYPNTSSTRPHKLATRSVRCVFLGYPADFRGYRCLDITIGRIILSRHVTFDETSFPFSSPTTNHNYSFLDSDVSPLLFQPQAASPSPPNSPTIPPRTIITYRRRQCHPAPAPPSPPPPLSTDHDLNPPPPSAPAPSHPMTTCSKVGTVKPKLPFNFSVTSSKPISPLPTSHLKALTDPNWNAAMSDEFRALKDNKTWVLVPRPPNTNIIRCMWLFRHKYNANGTLQRYKARLVVNGKSQQVGVDCDETFSPVVKPTTIRTVLSLAVSRGWPLHQLDVKNAFLHGDLHETVYMFQPPGFTDHHYPNHVCLLKKSLYGLKQAPRAWYDRFATYITKCGFRSTISDTSLFVYKNGSKMAYLLLYVDDIILTASDTTLLHKIIRSLSTEFAMSDLGKLHHFLGINVTNQNNGLFLSQATYATDILARAHMSDCKPSATPVDTASKLSATSGNLLPDGSLYRSLAGSLQYLTITRPDLTYAVQQLCLFMHAPREPHLQFLKRVLRYLKGTLHYGLTISPSKSTNLVAYSDADWGGAQTLADQHPGIVFFWETTSFHGHQSDNPLFLAPAPRLSTGASLMLSQKPVGCATYCWNYSCLLAKPH